MEAFAMGLLGGLCGSVPLAILLTRLYFGSKLWGLKRITDRLSMPMSKAAWTDIEARFYAFRNIIYNDSRDFLSAR